MSLEHVVIQTIAINGVKKIIYMVFLFVNWYGLRGN